jgi:hypothetical protein
LINVDAEFEEFAPTPLVCRRDIAISIAMTSKNR